MKLLLVSLLSAATGGILLGGWGIGSEHAELEGRDIVDVGTVTERRVHDPRVGQSLTWFQFSGSRGFCFETDGYVSLWSGETPALLVADRHDELELALFETSGIGARVDLRTFDLVVCPRPVDD